MTADRIPAMFDPGAESMPEDQRQGLQQHALRAMIDRLLAAGGLQGRMLAEAGVTSGADVALADLPRLPMTLKTDIWSQYPFQMLAVPLSEVVTVHGSSGTGGRPTLVAYTRADLQLWARMCARALAAAGATQGSIVHNAYGYGLFTGGLGIHQGAIELGATVIPVSGGMTSRQVTLIRDLRPDILTCTPSYAIRLGEALAQAGLGPAGGLAIRAGIFGAEPWTDALRARIEELLGLRALDIYGLAEIIGPGVAAECLVAADGLHVNEDHFLAEAVDPVTGAPVPDRRHRRAAPRHLRLRPHAGQDEQGHRPARRHAGDQGRQRVPERGGAGAARRAIAGARLPAGGGRAGSAGTAAGMLRVHNGCCCAGPFQRP